MIVDSHVHCGKNSPWGSFEIEYLIELLENVDYAICSNIEGIESANFKTEFECNMEMLKIFRKYNKIYPLLVCQPNISENESVIKSFLEKYDDFVGLKLHPESMKLPANDNRYDKYLMLAEKHNKPCLYHSGHIKSRFSSPKLIYEKAKEFPTVPIILGHLSTGPKQSHIDTINILIESIENETATLYVDTSWIDFAYEKLNETYEDTLMLIEALKNTKKGDYTHRILWASDCPVGIFNQSKESYNKNLAIFKKVILEKFNDEKLLENLLYNNAKNLYKIK